MTRKIEIDTATLLYMERAGALREERAMMCRRAAHAGFAAGEGSTWWRELAPLSNKERALVRKTVADAFAKKAAAVAG